MHDLVRYAGQALFYVSAAGLVGFLSSYPAYRQMPEGMAQIKLSFAHGGARKIDCRKLTSKEIAKLPAKDRRPNTCARERIPIHVRLTLDGNVLYDDRLQPTGLSSDGASQTYRKFRVSAGPHVIVAQLRDSKRASGFDYQTTHETTLKPLQNLAIDFKADAGGFLFR